MVEFQRTHVGIFHFRGSCLYSRSMLGSQQLLMEKNVKRILEFKKTRSRQQTWRSIVNLSNPPLSIIFYVVYEKRKISSLNPPPPSPFVLFPCNLSHCVLYRPKFRWMEIWNGFSVVSRGNKQNTSFCINGLRLWLPFAQFSRWLNIILRNYYTVLFVFCLPRTGRYGVA